MVRRLIALALALSICLCACVTASAGEDGYFSVLLLGTDRDGLTKQQIKDGAVGRADAIIYSSISLSNGDIAMLSIDRDYMVTLPEPIYETKLCTTTVLEGPELTLSEVNKALGTDAEYYAMVDYVDMRKILDEVGNITVEIYESDLQTKRYLSNSKAFRKAGVQSINSLQAIGLMRNRDYGALEATEGDATRNDRQRRVLVGIMDKLKTMDLNKLLKTLSKLLTYVKTNIDGAALLSLVPTILSFELGNPRQARFPVSSERKTVNMHSVILPGDPAWEQAQARTFLYGE